MGNEAPLKARIYGEKIGDYQTVSGWWEARHGKPLIETLLPPLGIIIEDEVGPAAALWCYQSVGIGVCFLEFPVTRPSLGLKKSIETLRFAVEACVQVAKANGDYSLFRCYTLPGIGRVLRTMGFVGGEQGWVQLTMKRD